MPNDDYIRNLCGASVVYNNMGVNRKDVFIVLLACALLASASAQPPCSPQPQVNTPTQAVGWDPVVCWDCPQAADFVVGVIEGYVIGAIIGLYGIARRRYNRLQPSEFRILPI